MKLIFPILLFCLAFTSNIQAQKSINNLFESMKEDDKSFAIKLPGWILNTGLKYALSKQDNEALNLFKDKIKGVRILINDDVKKDFTSALQKFTSSFAKDNLEMYASVKSDNTRVGVYVKEVKDKIKNVFFLINAEDSTVLLHLETDIALVDFQNADFSFKNLKK